jgi:hypoxanthine phosphoribosyltransferase
MSSAPASHTLIDQAAIAARVAELGAQISRDYAGVDSLLAVGVLRGAFIFLADLARHIDVPTQIDFIALASYNDDTSHSGEVRLIMDVRHPIEGRHVLVVEDIVDSGHTMTYLTRLFGSRQPASLRLCTLLRKPDRLHVDVPVDYVGFDIPDEWVIGYGMDLADHWRNLPEIGVVHAPESG